MARKKDPNPKPDKKEQQWKLVSDEINTTVEGQFAVEEMNLGSYNSTFADISTTNQFHPVTQWIKGELQNITFEAMFWENDTGDPLTSDLLPFDSIKERYKGLQELSTYNDKLKRQPICMFTYGKSVELKCFANISNIRTGYLTPKGAFRHIKFTLTLRRFVESVHKATDPTALESNTFYHKVNTEDSYETIARKHYNQPLYGEIIRRFQGHKPDLTEGDVVVVPKLAYVMRRRKIEPQTHIFGDTDEAKNRIDEIFEERSDSLRIIGE